MKPHLEWVPLLSQAYYRYGRSFDLGISVRF
jgi:hypothetical protein